MAFPVIDGGVVAGMPPDDGLEPDLVELGKLEPLEGELEAPVGAPAPFPALLVTGLTLLLGDATAAAPLLVPLCANGLWEGPVGRELFGVDCTFSVGIDAPGGGGGAGSGACATGVGLEELDSRTGTATIPASSKAATGQSFF